MKTIILTGCSKGLGYSLAKEFLKEGHKVYGSARSENPWQDLQRDFPQKAHYQSLDISNYSDVQNWRDMVFSREAKIDFLINNAAIINPSQAFWTLKAEQTGKLVDINIKGTMHTLHAFLPKMIEKNHGIIINFSSGWGRSVSPDVASYCCSKWAIEGLSRSLALELPSNMASIPLNPGIINTEMLQSCFGSQATNYPDPNQWAIQAAPYILSLSPKDNGQARSVS